VKIDQLLLEAPHRAPRRPRVGIAPRISDAELLTLCVMQALLSSTSKTRWLRYAECTCGTCSWPPGDCLLEGCDHRGAVPEDGKGCDDDDNAHARCSSCRGSSLSRCAVI
jgi:hypothetical protein